MFKIVLFGAGGHARSCVEVIEKSKKYKIQFLVDNKKNLKLNPYKIIKEEKLLNIKKKCNKALISFGGIKNLELRNKKYLELKKIGFAFPVIISNTSYVSYNSNIGDGSILMNQSLVNAGAKIGKNCIINTRAVIEHDVTIQDNCHISTGSIVNGNVKIEKNTFIGSGSIIFNNIKIGKNCVVSAGSIIKRNIPDNAVIK
tara:strand:- start:497 stop:1096 length:600 start_codon:yes stop_codon:yes gene_type:complete